MNFICILVIINLFFGFIFAYKSKKITYLEFFIVSACVWIAMLIIYGIYWNIRVSDTKFINDKIISLRYEGPWVSEYTCCKIHRTSCSGSGKNRHCTRYCAVWGTCYRNEGDYSEYTLAKNGTHYIQNEKRIELQNKYFDGPKKVLGKRPSYHDGDKYDYVWTIREDKIAPWTDTRLYKNYIAPSENIIKGSFNVGKEVKKHPTDNLKNNFDYNKVIGINLDQTKLAILNSSLNNDANIVIYGFKNGSLSDCENLKAKWIGGKVNDLVFCLIHDNRKITAAKVFGWTENEVLKKELESLILDKDITSFFSLSKEIKHLIDNSYVTNDMSKYNYLTINIRGVDYIMFVIFYILLVIGAWSVAYNNNIVDIEKIKTGKWTRNTLDKEITLILPEGFIIHIKKEVLGTYTVYVDSDYNKYNIYDMPFNNFYKECHTKNEVITQIKWIQEYYDCYYNIPSKADFEFLNSF